MGTMRSARLAAIAVETEEKAIERLKPGVWRRFCPLCRGEYMPHEPTCPRCVERNAEILRQFREQVKETLKKARKKDESVTRNEVEQALLSDMRGKISAAKWYGKDREARRLESVLAVLDASKIAKLYESHIAKRLKSIDDPEERIRVEKQLRSNIAPDIQEKLDIARAVLPEPVEVAGLARRKLQDYVYRASTKGRRMFSTSTAARGLGFADIESFIHAAAKHGIKPVQDFGSARSVRQKEQISRRLREEGQLPTPELEEERPMQYAVWDFKDIARLKRILKNRALRDELETKVKELEKEVSTLYEQAGEIRSQLAELADMEKKAPERMSDIYKGRSELRLQLAGVEHRRKERMKELQNARAKLEETPVITF